MDYRVVKQYLNDAIDNFFKFMYKTADFGKVLVDTGLAFFEIWYNLAMFFVNLFLYLYYLILLAIDRMSMSSAPVFFWRRKGRATRQDFSRAYNRNMVNPVSGMYAKSGTYSSVSSAVADSAGWAAKSVADTAASAAGSVQSAAESVVAAKVSVKRPNIFGRFFRGIGSIFAAIFKGIFGFFKAIWRFILSKLKPVKEKPVGRKNLIDDYMKQYETRKK